MGHTFVSAGSVSCSAGLWRTRGATITSLVLSSRAAGVFLDGSGWISSMRTRMMAPFEVQIGTTMSCVTMLIWFRIWRSSSSGCSSSTSQSSAVSGLTLTVLARLIFFFGMLALTLRQQSGHTHESTQ